MKSFRPILAVAAATAAVMVIVPSARASMYLTISRGSAIPRASAYYAPSPLAGVRREMSAAVAGLSKALAAAAKNDVLANEAKTAQSAVDKARRDYTAALAEARKNLAADPHVGPLQKDVRAIEQRLAEQKDAGVRLGIVSELMAARNKLNTAEWEVLGVEPDLAITKAAIGDATDALRDVQSRRQSAIQQDPSVVAARQRVDALRHQLAMGH